VIIKNSAFIGLIIMACSAITAQEAILCLSYNSYVRIEIPTVAKNPDGTINLVFTEAYMTHLN